MSAYKIVSNIGKNYLDGAGGAEISGDNIRISLKPHSLAQILRHGKLLSLLKTEDTPKNISGRVEDGDVYTIGLGEQRLVLRVEKNEPDIYLKTPSLYQSEPKAKKATLLVGVVLLAFLLISVILGIKQKNSNKTKEIYGAKLSQAVSSYEESLKTFEVDKNKSREMFSLSQSLLKEVVDAKYQDERVNKLSADLESKQAEILGEYKQKPSEFLDLTLQTSEFNGLQMASSGNEMFVFDKEHEKLIQVNIKSKKATIAADSDQLNGSDQVSSYEDRVFASKDDGIYELGGSSEDQVVEKDWASDNPFFYMYSANIYLLDKDSNMIYRFPGDSDGFGKKAEWISPGIEPDFSKIVDMTIDGSIWLLSSTGRVSKFTMGSPQSIAMDGLVDPLDNPTAIYTNEENKNVYILDKNKGRVVVLDKTGDFVVQYVDEEIKNSKDIVVSEAEKKIILLNGPKLLFLEIK